MKKNFSNAQITSVMERDGITRKSAIRKLGKMTERQLGEITPKFKAAPVTATQAANPLPVTLATATPDFKSRAANDDTKPVVMPGISTTGTPSAPAKAAAAKKAATPKPPAPATPAGDARKEGIRLFALAGKPKKEDFIHVYGEMGAKWTWVARAKAVGLNTAEEAAKQFQKMRAGKPQQFVKAESTPEKK